MKLLSCALLGGALSVGPVVAQSVGAELPELIISAHRAAWPVQKVGSAWSALSPAEEERRGVLSLEELLGRVPGASVLSEGGQWGSISALRMRGTESDHTQWRIDGVRINDANLTAFHFLGQGMSGGWESVEVLRGPQSALYGGEALGGVVALETGRGGNSPNQASVTVGSFGTWQGSWQAGAETAGGSWFAQLGQLETSNDGPNQDFQSTQAALRLEKRLTPSWVTGLTLRPMRGDFEYETPWSGLAKSRREALLGSVYLRGAWREGLNSDLTLGFYEEKFEEKSGNPFSSRGRKVSLDWRHELAWGEGTRTIFGLFGERTSYEATATGQEDEQNLGALYLEQILSPVEELTLSAGGRLESYEAWDVVWSGRVTAHWQTPLPGLALRGSYGTAFRAPSFYELYGQSNIPGFAFEGNADLQPETSQGWDLGLDWSAGEKTRLALTFFRQELEDFITYEGGTAPATYQNAGEAQVQGVELEASGSLGSSPLHWLVSATWLESEDEESELDLLRRPDWSALAEVSYRCPKQWEVGLGLRHLGARDDLDFTSYPSERVRLSSATLAHLWMRYAWQEGRQVRLRLENLLDRDYEFIAGKKGRGFGAFVGMDWEF